MVETGKTVGLCGLETMQETSVAHMHRREAKPQEGTQAAIGPGPQEVR